MSSLTSLAIRIKGVCFDFSKNKVEFFSEGKQIVPVRNGSCISGGHFALPVQVCQTRSEIVEAYNLLGVKVLKLDPLVV